MAAALSDLVNVGEDARRERPTRRPRILLFVTFAPRSALKRARSGHNYRDDDDDDDERAYHAWRTTSFTGSRCNASGDMLFTVRATRCKRDGDSNDLSCSRLISSLPPSPPFVFASTSRRVLSLRSVAPAVNADIGARDRRRGRTGTGTRRGTGTERTPRVEGGAEGEPGGGGRGRRRREGGSGRPGGGERNTRDRQHSFVLSLARFGSQLRGSSPKYSERSKFAHSPSSGFARFASPDRESGTISLSGRSRDF